MEHKIFETHSKGLKAEHDTLTKTLLATLTIDLLIWKS